MTSRILSAAMAAAFVSLVAGGCTADTTSAPSATPETGSTTTAALPDPVPSDLPVRAKILVQRQVSGATTLDLTNLVGSAKTVNVRWTCVGGNGLKIIHAASNTIVGGGCVSTAAAATYLGGDVPLSIVFSHRWTLQADAATHWRVAVTTGK